ncbi:MAG: extracellular solute-binding protein [Firmicutes bacterium]|nr:extracellular solute-binding protein [Bacillota bacterium]
MKRFLALLLALAMVFSLAACTSSNEPAAEPETETEGEATGEDPDTGKLVIYTSFTDAQMPLITDFEAQTGIKVEVITDGASALLKRVEAEKDAPYADIIIGGSKTIYGDYLDLFEEYVTPNDEFLAENHHVEYNKLTPYSADSILIMWNTNLIGDIEIKGFADLLKPELKGKIAMADPAAASSAASALCLMAWVMGDHQSYFSDASIEYLTEFAKNLDGKLAAGSSACHKSCADGEYTCAVTFNSAVYNYINEGAPVSFCYPEEGVSPFSDVGAIIKGAANMKSAKMFMDYITSKEVQSRMGAEMFSNPVRVDAELPDYMVAPDAIYESDEDAVLRAENMAELKEKWNDIWASVN